MRTPYKAPQFLHDIQVQQIAANVIDNQERALLIKQFRIERGYAYQFVADFCNQKWFRGVAPWPTQNKTYWVLGEAFCREAAKQLSEPFEYPWSD